MTKMIILAAVAAVSLACANRSEEEVGAAPDQGDTTAVTHVIDSTRTGPPGVGGRPGNATVTADSVGADSALTNQENAGTPGDMDTTSTWTSTPQDTLGPQDTGVQDTTMMNQDSTMMHGDSAMTGHAVPDTTGQ
ncbi:MAG: hypothetical protein H0T58_13070 [Gemmatimonadales bacterium]|nr:hypothetical protein [Gemmatimonadales bacterium]